MNNFMVMLPVIFLANKVDLTVGDRLLMARAGYALALAAVLSVYAFLYKKVTTSKDETDIWVEPPKTPQFGQPQPELDRGWLKTTYHALELAQVKQLLQSTAMGAVMIGLIHFKMGVNQVLLIQLAVLPSTMYNSPIFQRHIMGAKAAHKEHTERPTEPLGDASAEESDTTTAEEALEDDGSAEAALTAAVARAWTAGADADYAPLLAIADKHGHVLDTPTVKSKWTALMVVAGNKKDGVSTLDALVAAGASLTAKDGDGWTALHWAVFHNRAAHVTTLLAAAERRAQTAELLAIKDSEGNTPLQLALAEGFVDIAAELRTAAAGGAADDDSDAAKKAEPAAAIDDLD
eukprot:PLAT3280.36.p2 GENE.PLAT3280.36~~PLAT3280.36.p2  ORF type:complete len:348 (+),score=211.47 PLAT3280.36:82-1125(+)